MKKKVLVLIFLVTVLSSLFVGCDRLNYAKTEKSYDIKNENINSMFVEVENTPEWKVVYDKETRVMYSVATSGVGTGQFTMLVDEDGKPKLWGGE
jgi:hypothetical protein